MYIWTCVKQMEMPDRLIPSKREAERVTGCLLCGPEGIQEELHDGCD